MPNLRESINGFRANIAKNVELLRKAAGDELNKQSSEHFRTKRADPARSEAAAKRADEAAVALDWLDELNEGLTEDPFVKPDPEPVVNIPSIDVKTTDTQPAKPAAVAAKTAAVATEK